MTHCDDDAALVDSNNGGFNLDKDLKTLKHSLFTRQVDHLLLFGTASKYLREEVLKHLYHSLLNLSLLC